MEVKNIDIQIDPEYTMHKKIKDNLFLSKEEICNNAKQYKNNEYFSYVKNVR